MAGLCLFPLAAQAQFPDRPIKLIVPYAAGGGTDAIARLVAQGMSENLGQSVVVENNGSAGGNIAVAQAAGAPPDGYTILMANQGPMTVNPHMFKSVKVDPLAAFDALTLIAAAPLVLVVPKNSPFQSFQDLIDYAKKNPGKLSYGSAGNGSASHVAVLLLGEVAGIQMVHVPYRGAGPALNDLVGGQTQFMITTLPSVTGLVHGGQLRALAVTSRKAIPQLPGIPAIAEAGYPDYESTAWYGFVVPKGVPAAVKERLSTAIAAAIRSDVIRGRLSDEGAAPIGNSAQEFATMMAQESARWKKVIAASGFKLD
ncbi:tripartite tricarboxylate transporter substrate binding protein [Rhizobiales bacterium TNE-4]|nr:tripartite tricarboxylate transporter substrate binding protein [Rhizobiales bacterium TNE-4]MBV1828483.1 tripartite tricarboxylate transporter substrate binding protein [Rhizobiales bacterium TNE-4]